MDGERYDTEYKKVTNVGERILWRKKKNTVDYEGGE